MATSLRERWQRPPRLRTVGAEDEERHATWLELFFDLVFVICIAEVVHTLEDDRTLGGFLGTAGLFVPIWWAWVGYTVYADRFDTDDLLHRVLVLAGMLAVIAMALSVHDALHGGSARFALTYVAVRTVVLLLNARARRHAAPARPLLNLYLAAFTASAALWLVSVLVPEPYRYLLWAVGTTIELSAPWLGRRQIAQAPIHASHMTERYGLFTLIVLGESVISVAQGAAGVDWEPGTLAVALTGFLVVACLWWIYFEYISGLANRSVLQGLCFNYAHLPLLAGLVSVALGIELAVVESAAHELERATAMALGGGTALYLLALTALHAATGHSISDRVLWLRLGSAVVALAIGVFGPLGAPLGLVGLLAVLLVAHVAAETVLQHRAAYSTASPTCWGSSPTSARRISATSWRWPRRPRRSASTPRWCSAGRAPSAPSRPGCTSGSAPSATGSCSGRTSPPCRGSSRASSAAWQRSAWARSGCGRCCGATAPACSAWTPTPTAEG